MFFKRRKKESKSAVFSRLRAVFFLLRAVFVSGRMVAIFGSAVIVGRGFGLSLLWFSCSFCFGKDELSVSCGFCLRFSCCFLVVIVLIFLEFCFSFFNFIRASYRSEGIQYSPQVHGVGRFGHIRM